MKREREREKKKKTEKGKSVGKSCKVANVTRSKAVMRRAEDSLT